MSAADRTTEIALRRLNGESYSAIARDYGITWQRVQQIVAKAGVGSLARGKLVAFDAARFLRQTTESYFVASGVHRNSIRRWRTWRREAVTILRRLAGELGRAPTYAELAHACGLGGPHAAQRLVGLGSRWTGRTRNPQSRTLGVRRWYRLAGLAPYRCGCRPEVA